MDSSYTKARAELMTSAKYWQELAEIPVPLPEDVDTSKALDHAALQMDLNRHRTVMFALGGCNFSDETVVKHMQGLHMPWFRVVSNAAGKFTVVNQ
eukprot:gene18327-24789_t